MRRHSSRKIAVIVISMAYVVLVSFYGKASRAGVMKQVTMINLNALD